jgi:hypothetical protein
MAGIYPQDHYGSRGGQVRILKMVNEAVREGGAH